ncbi:MAG: PIN domain-containing protein [Candidatus Bathyarchaeia archaeon]|jgi:predicted nucleic acid-binding protein|nr:PIN domain-containing protein [Candidatus Bathyarchaeota archaeon]
MKMNKAAVYDTRFFTQLYRSKDDTIRKKIRNEKIRKEKYVSTIVIHELYNTSMATEGRETAKLKVTFLKQDFEIIPVDDQIAEISAELRHKYHLSMGDSMIAATAFTLKAVCITDDQHIKQIKEIETAWI